MYFKIPFKFFRLNALLLFLPLQLCAEPLMVGNFSQGDISGWETKHFENETSYAITMLDKTKVIKSTTNDSASAFYRDIKVNLEKTPFLNWSWRVENRYSGTDPLKKSGDDYPARIYVVLSGGFFPWNTLALNYIFSNNSEPVNSHWASPFTAHSHLVVKDSAIENLKQLKSFKVNVKEDFEKYFGKKITEIDGVAIMSDSDNAHFSSNAYFGDIYFTEN